MLIVVQPSILASQGSLLNPQELLEIGRGIFALILFAVSLYAWYLRRQTSLVIVAVAFLMFFIKTIIFELLPPLPDKDFINDFLDFVALTLFFLAIVVRPRKDISKGTT
jgi:ABC-type iron transport system FetAB permease component